MPEVGTQGSLFASIADEPTLTAPIRTVRRTLSHGAWIDVLPSFVTGADQVFDRLYTDVPWRAERREMYDRIVDVPRLVRIYHEDELLPHPILVNARTELTRHYRPELPEGFATAGMCLYRNGSDSVAWHGDTIGRGRTHDTMVAIVSLGSPRTLLLRPRGGGQSVKFPLSHGDAVVMGGSCQRTWEHCIPKTTQAVGPRISVQFRPLGVF